MATSSARTAVTLIVLASAPAWYGCGPSGDGGGTPAPGTSARVAQEVREHVTPGGLARSLDSIVQYDRRSGTEGEQRALEFVLRELRSEGIPTRVDTFRAYVSDPVSASVRAPAADPQISPEALTVSFSGTAEGVTAPVVDVGAPDDLPGLALATGERLLLECELEAELERPTGTPGGVAAGRGDRGRACEEAPDLRGRVALIEALPIPETAWKLERLGAAGAIFVNPEDRLNALIVSTLWAGPSLRNQHRVPSLPLAEVRKSDGERLRSLLEEDPELRVRLDAEVNTRWKQLRLVQAAIPAENPVGSFAVLGGHIDSWWRGATDEAASNAAMLELARAFWDQRERLRRGLVVAWWPGHSNARYAGSRWYADHHFQQLRQRAVAYLNVDGIGQRDAATFDAATTVSLADVARNAVQEVSGQTVEPARPVRNSDQSFNGIGLPLLQIYHRRPDSLGGYWWWHSRQDTRDKIDASVLDTDAGAYAGALADLLVSPRLPVDPVDQVDHLGQVLHDRQAAAPRRFDLSAEIKLQSRLLEAVEAVEEALPSEPDERVNLERLRVLRPVHRVLYTLNGSFHPDPSVDLGRLPGLRPVEELAESDRGSHRYEVTRRTLVRERNRLHEALETSLERADRLRARLVAGEVGTRGGGQPSRTGEEIPASDDEAAGAGEAAEQGSEP